MRWRRRWTGTRAPRHAAVLDGLGLAEHAGSRRANRRAAAALLAAGARVTEGMIEVAADELSVVLEEAGARTGILRVTERSYLPGRPVRISVRRRGLRHRRHGIET